MRFCGDPITMLHRENFNHPYCVCVCVCRLESTLTLLSCLKTVCHLYRKPYMPEETPAVLHLLLTEVVKSTASQSYTCCNEYQGPILIQVNYI